MSFRYFLLKLRYNDHFKMVGKKKLMVVWWGRAITWWPRGRQTWVQQSVTSGWHLGACGLLSMEGITIPLQASVCESLRIVPGIHYVLRKWEPALLSLLSISLNLTTSESVGRYTQRPLPTSHLMCLYKCVALLHACQDKKDVICFFKVCGKDSLLRTSPRRKPCKKLTC